MIVTDMVGSVRADERKVDAVLSPLGAIALGSAMVFDPSLKTIRRWTAATVHKQIAPWMSRLLSAYAIIQVIEAERVASKIAELVDGEIDATAHPDSGARKDADEMLTVLDVVFRPDGQRPSPWCNNAELDDIRGLLNSGNCFSSGDKSGLSAEFPFGNNTTSLMRVITTENNPTIGSGVGIFLELPLRGTKEAAAQTAAALNRAEASSRAPGHLLGSWCSRGDGESSLPAFACFIPAAFYQPKLLTNLAIAFVSRAQWAHELLSPETKPFDVKRLVMERFGTV
jgi:hypothetical protein